MFLLKYNFTVWGNPQTKVLGATKCFNKAFWPELIQPIKVSAC